MTWKNFLLLKLTLAACLATLFGFWLYNLRVPLVGPHQIRQADTQAMGYYYCFEDPRFGYPRLAARDDTTGVAIGELPLYSYLLGMSCRALGFWSEATPKIMTALFFLLAIFAWGNFARRRFGARPNDWLLWMVAFVSVPLNLTYLMIPMPEATAIALLGLAAWMWTRPLSRAWVCDTLGAFCFLIGFLVRPYHIWLLFVTAPNFTLAGAVLAACVAGFFGWYRWWAPMVTTLPGYFAINLDSKYLGEWIWRSLAATPKRLLDLTLYIGLHPLAIGSRLEPLWGIGFWLSWLSILILKPRHLMAHPYYLMSPAVFGSVLMFLGLRTLEYRKQLAFGVVFVIASFVTIQHHFRPGRDWPEIEKTLRTADQIAPPEARVITYTDGNPMWLYYLKRRGTASSLEHFKGPAGCPPGYDFYFKSAANDTFDFAKCVRP